MVSAKMTLKNSTLTKRTVAMALQNSAMKRNVQCSIEYLFLNSASIFNQNCFLAQNLMNSN